MASEQVKRIGFVDYRLDNFHADIYLKMIRGPLAARGFTVAGASALDAAPSRSWAEQNSVPYFDSVAALDEAVDFFAVLAPSNPELHLELCKTVFPFGKTTFVDKTFAPNLPTSRKIFALADEHGVAIQTTSALRSTATQEWIRQTEAQLVHMATWAGGSSWEEYGIHPVELVVSCLGANVVSVMRQGDNDHPVLTLRFDDGRLATIDFNCHHHVDFQSLISTKTGVELIRVDDEKLFEDAASFILDFFDAGKPLVDRQETLVIRAILDAAMTDQALGQFYCLDL